MFFVPLGTYNISSHQIQKYLNHNFIGKLDFTYIFSIIKRLILSILKLEGKAICLISLLLKVYSLMLF